MPTRFLERSAKEVFPQTTAAASDAVRSTQRPTPGTHDRNTRRSIDVNPLLVVFPVALALLLLIWNAWQRRKQAQQRQQQEERSVAETQEQAYREELAKTHSDLRPV